MSDSSPSCLIIGAGISGLLAGSILQKNGVHVTIVDKSRGVGGRLATRRVGEARLDHGAQYFTVRDRIFGGWAEAWENSGLIKEWFRRFPEQSSEAGHVRFCGRNGMTDVPKALASELNVKNNSRVTKIRYKDSHWYVTIEDGQKLDAQYLILTAPAPQSLELIKESNIVLRRQKLEALENIRYEKTIALLAILDGPSGLKEPGCFKVEEPPLSWVADNQMKGISKIPAITAHSTYQFAEDHWDDDPEAIQKPLVEALSVHLESKITEASLQKWRYALPISPFEQPFFFSRRHSLLMAGDAFGGPRVEGAALSGIEAAAHLIDFL
jgi:hypothetical protein